MYRFENTCLFTYKRAYITIYGVSVNLFMFGVRNIFFKNNFARNLLY